MSTTTRARQPAVQFCSTLQAADEGRLCLAVGDHEGSPTAANKPSYLGRKSANTADFGFLETDSGTGLQSAGVCRNNTRVVDNIMRQDTERASEARERVSHYSTYVRTIVCINNTYIQTYSSGRDTPDFGGITIPEIGMHSSRGVCTAGLRGWS